VEQQYPEFHLFIKPSSYELQSSYLEGYFLSLLFIHNVTINKHNAFY
jgi:hypothetical protein